MHELNIYIIQSNYDTYMFHKIKKKFTKVSKTNIIEKILSYLWFYIIIYIYIKIFLIWNANNVKLIY